MWPQKGLSPTEAAAIAEVASSAFRSARNFFRNIAARNTRNNMATNSPTAPSRAYDQNNTTQGVNQNPELRQERTIVLEGLAQGDRAQTHLRTNYAPLPKNSTSDLFQATNEEMNPDESQNSRDLSLLARELEISYGLTENYLDPSNFESEEKMLKTARLVGHLLAEDKKAALAADEARLNDPEPINKKQLREALNLTKTKLGPYEYEICLNSILTLIYDLEPYPIPEKVMDDHILKTIAWGLELEQTWTDQSQIPAKKIKLLRKHSGDIWKFYLRLHEAKPEIQFNLERNAQKYTPQQSSNTRCQGSETKIKFGADSIIPQHMLPSQSHLNSAAAKTPKGILKNPSLKNNFIIIEAPTRCSLINSRAEAEADQLSLGSDVGCLDDFDDFDAGAGAQARPTEAKQTQGSHARSKRIEIRLNETRRTKAERADAERADTEYYLENQDEYEYGC